MFKLKITKKEKLSKDNWGISIDLPPRIGMPSSLIEGDIIVLDTNKQYMVVRIERYGNSEDVFGIFLDNSSYHREEKLSPRQTYSKLVANIKMNQWSAWSNLDERSRKIMIEGSWENFDTDMKFAYSFSEPRHVKECIYSPALS